VDVYGRLFNFRGEPKTDEFVINSYAPRDQRYSSVSMDANGDFIVTWSSQRQDNSWEVYVKRFDANGAVTEEASAVTDNTVVGDQMYSAVALNDKGDTVIAWSQKDANNSWDISAKQYVIEPDVSNPVSDRVGPVVAGVYLSDGISSGSSSPQRVSQLRVIFSEPLTSTSATNVSNWQLTQGGIDRNNFIQNISYALNQNGQAEVKINFFAPLSVGQYSLTIKGQTLSEKGDLLDGNADGIPGGDFSRNISVDVLIKGSETTVNWVQQSNQKGSENTPKSVGTAPNGDYVVTWSSLDQDGDGWGVYAQRYRVDGTRIGPEFLVNTTSRGNQETSAVAVDAKGNFVITWVGLDNSSSGVYARRYDAQGNALGKEFLVNTYSSSEQEQPSIGMDVEGNFVISWSSWFEDGSYWGVFAQRFNAAGVAQGLSFQVNDVLTDYYNQQFSSVAMDASGEFVITWSSAQQADNWTYNVYAKRYDEKGRAIGGEFLVNQTTSGDQVYSRAASDRAGNFVIVWEGKSANGTVDVYGRLFNFRGEPKTDEFVINSYAPRDQRYSSISMDANGDFIVTWSSDRQDGDGWGVYAQRFNAEGEVQGSEFQVHSTVEGNQQYSSIGVDDAGNFTIVWSQQDPNNSSWDIKAQRFVSYDSANVKSLVVAGIFAPNQPAPIIRGEYIAENISQFQVFFSQPLNIAAVQNLANWQIIRNTREDVSDLIQNITYQINSIGQVEVLVRLRQSLSSGEYTFTIKDDILSWLTDKSA
jgi:hypothetical protein